MDRAGFSKYTDWLQIHLAHLIILMSLFSAASLITDYLIDECTIKIDENMYKNTMFEIASADTQVTKVSTLLTLYVMENNQNDNNEKYSKEYEAMKKDCENGVKNYTNEYRYYQSNINNTTKDLKEYRGTRSRYILIEKFFLFLTVLLNVIILVVIEVIKKKEPLKKLDRDE
jgi:hypothetical protein